jgi:hypothetical protein
MDEYDQRLQASACLEAFSYPGPNFRHALFNEIVGGSVRILFIHAFAQDLACHGAASRAFRNASPCAASPKAAPRRGRLRSGAPKNPEKSEGTALAYTRISRGIRRARGTTGDGVGGAIGAAAEQPRDESSGRLRTKSVRSYPNERSRGETSSYLAARIARDAPELYEPEAKVGRPKKGEEKNSGKSARVTKDRPRDRAARALNVSPQKAGAFQSPDESGTNVIVHGSLRA